MKKRLFLVCMVVFATVIMTAVAASANTGGTDLSDHSDAIIAQFTGTANDIIPIIIGVLGAGLVIFAIFVGIKKAKSMFKTVSS